MSGESRFKGKRMGERKSIMKLQQTAMPHSAVPCHRCGENRLTVFPLFEQMSRVTSDSRPWPLGGKSAICQQCALIQKVVDDSWRKEVRDVMQVPGEERAMWHTWEHEVLGKLLARHAQVNRRMQDTRTTVAARRSCWWTRPPMRGRMPCTRRPLLGWVA